MTDSSSTDENRRRVACLVKQTVKEYQKDLSHLEITPSGTLIVHPEQFNQFDMIDIKVAIRKYGGEPPYASFAKRSAAGRYSISFNLTYVELIGYDMYFEYEEFHKHPIIGAVSKDSCGVENCGILALVAHEVSHSFAQYLQASDKKLYRLFNQNNPDAIKFFKVVKNVRRGDHSAVWQAVYSYLRTKHGLVRKHDQENYQSGVDPSVQVSFEQSNTN